jgi:hypothetical protein
MYFVERSCPVPITIKNPRTRRWLWFVGIYAGSVLAFGGVLGVLEWAVPK